MSLSHQGPIRVALVNDVELLLRGIAAMLEPYGDRVRVVELGTTLPATGELDVVLYDTFGSPPRDDQRLRRLVAERGLAVIIFSWDAHPGHRPAVAGVDGHLHKSASAQEVVEAIEAVHAGRPVGPPAQGEQRQDRRHVSESGLSVREAEMLTLIARGHTNQEIAELCYLSVNSVKTYIRSAYRKIGVTRRAEAVRWGWERGAGVPDLPAQASARD